MSSSGRIHAFPQPADGPHFRASASTADSGVARARDLDGPHADREHVQGRRTEVAGERERPGPRARVRARRDRRRGFRAGWWDWQQPQRQPPGRAGARRGYGCRAAEAL